MGLLGLAACSIAVALPVHAQPLPTLPVVSPLVAPDTPLTTAGTPYVKDNGEVLLMVCRRGLQRQDMQPMQELQQDLPLLCLVTQTDDQVLQMGPARFQQLMDSAASSGAMWLVVLPE